MSYYFPEGSQFYFTSTFAGAKTISAVTNANPAAATSTSHGYVDNDIVLFSSGWEDATDTLYKVNQTGADNFEFLGLNSTDTDYFAAGSGTGSTYLASSWVSIPQVLSISTSGGDPRFTTISPLARRNAINVPTGFNPASITVTLGHDPADANYLTMINISRTLTKVGIKIALGGGGTMYGYGYLSVSEIPSLNVGQPNSVQASFALLGKPISYSS